jgi:glyoxylase-like metal-dependent hydrolase (beta-lactamase superfamily II)
MEDLKKSTKTGLIPNTKIISIKFFINKEYYFFSYIIKTNNGYIMIDAGFNIKNIEPSLKKAGIGINDVKWILLTHSDSDHVDALPFFPNAKIYMNKDELPLINGTMKRNESFGNKMPDGIDIDKIVLLSNDQELLFEETKIQCLKAPGHTIGSMLYLIDNKYLFTGDALMIKNGKIKIHPFSMDPELSEKTIEELKDTINNSSLILTSHYGFAGK